MSDTMYTITKICYDKLETKGYVIQSSEGGSKTLKQEDVITLTRRGKITNATAVLGTDGLFKIKIDKGVDSLDVVYKNDGLLLDITCRVLDNKGKCIGYKANDSSGKVYNITVGKAWELAMHNNINNVKAAVTGNIKEILSQKDFRLFDVPVLNE